MPDIKVDKLYFEVAGLSGAEGEQLTRLIAEELGSTASPDWNSREVANLEVKLGAAPGTPVDTLSKMITAELVRELRRTT
jgi:hypothetical protein